MLGGRYGYRSADRGSAALRWRWRWAVNWSGDGAVRQWLAVSHAVCRLTMTLRAADPLGAAPVPVEMSPGQASRAMLASPSRVRPVGSRIAAPPASHTPHLSPCHAATRPGLIPFAARASRPEKVNAATHRPLATERLARANPTATPTAMATAAAAAGTCVGMRSKMDRSRPPLGRALGGMACLRCWTARPPRGSAECAATGTE
eukprot:scaffold7348_cov113-Isochrysis_galbana.AAC.1